MADIPEVQPPQIVESVLSKYKKILISKVRPSKHQARKVFDEEALKNLAESMKAEGLITAITVREDGDGYELIAGERRWRAAQLLGWTEIEAKVIQPVSEAEAAAKGLIENIQRADLTPLEEAQGFQDILDLKDDHWNQEQRAKVTGKSKGYISQSLAFLDFPPMIKEKFSRLNFSRSHALELLRLADKTQQEDLTNKIIDENLTREQTRNLVNGILEKHASPDVKNKEKGAADPLNSLWKELQKEKMRMGQWKVAYPKEDAWDFHFKPNPERPVDSLAEILLDFCSRILQFNAKMTSGRRQTELETSN